MAYIVTVPHETIANNSLDFWVGSSKFSGKYVNISKLVEVIIPDKKILNNSSEIINKKHAVELKRFFDELQKTETKCKIIRLDRRVR